MSAVSALIQDMIAAGVSAELIGRTAALLAEREAVVVPDEQAERRRAKDRERKRLRNSAESAEFQNVVPPKKETSPTPPKEKTTPLSSDPTGLRCLSARKHDWPADFAEQVWSIYPRKTEKQPSMVALAELHRKDRLDWETLIGGLENLIANVEPQFAPALHRWLKKARWTDQHVPPARAGPAKGPTKFDRLDDAFGDIFHGPVQSQPRLRLASGS